MTGFSLPRLDGLTVIFRLDLRYLDHSKMDRKADIRGGQSHF